MKTKRQKIIALIPCYNEEGGIGAVIKSFPIEKIHAHAFDLEIVVIDNNSSDRTGKIARSLGATVLHEPQKGKGNAIRRGFEYACRDADYIVMLDGDDTYRPEEILRLVEPLHSGFCSVVIGSRLGGRITEGSMKPFNRMGNWVYSHLVRYFYNINVTDALTGYFAWTREALEQLRPHLVSSGFAIEMEMVTKMARLGLEVSSVPISYDDRAGVTNLRPIYDGSRILLMFARNFFWKPQPPKIQKIAFVSDAVMPYNKGGKERRLYEISKRLVRDNREIHIYTMQWWDGPKTMQYEGVYYHALCKYHPLYSGDRRSIWQAFIFSLATFKLLFTDFDILDVDHMPFFPLFSARVVTWFKGKRLHATWHEVWGRDYWMEYMKGISGIFGHFTERLSFMLPDVIISNSAHTTSRLRLAGFAGEIETIPLGVDVVSIERAKTSKDKSDIIFVGRLLTHKNVDLLIRAVSRVKQTHPDIVCKIVGDGPERQNIEDLIVSLDLQDNIQTHEPIEDHARLYGLMKASKMFVLPSVREGFGLVAVEANAAGLPVITTSHRNNAAKDLINEGRNGMLTVATDAGIARKIMHLMRYHKRMKPRENIERYDWHEVAESLGRTLK